MPNEQEHSDAVVAALNGLGGLAFDLGDVPTPAPDKYTEVTVTRRFGGEQRGSGERDGQLYRITARQVSKVFQNAQNLRVKSSGLEGLVLTVAGEKTTPIEFESADTIGEDDGWYSGLETWTYGI